MNHSSRPAFRVRTLGAAVVLGTALALSGCGLDAQTLKPYTPAHGVNVDDGSIKVRNLLVIADQQGRGVLSGSFASAADDSLASVTGTALNPDGTPAATLTVAGAPVPLKRGGLAVLTSATTPIRLSSPSLKPGLLAHLQLTFGSGVSTEVTVPVLSVTDPIYTPAAPLLTPTAPAPSASPSTTPVASAPAPATAQPSTTP